MREQIRSLTAANEIVRQAARVFEEEVASLQLRIIGLKGDLVAAKAASGIRKPAHLNDAELNVKPDMLARLIRLAHPDKHGNSQASNEATAWLLAQRTSR
jgi:hypothetical protein